MIFNFEIVINLLNNKTKNRIIKKRSRKLYKRYRNDLGEIISDSSDLSEDE